MTYAGPRTGTRRQNASGLFLSSSLLLLLLLPASSRCLLPPDALLHVCVHRTLGDWGRLQRPMGARAGAGRVRPEARGEGRTAPSKTPVHCRACNQWVTVARLRLHVCRTVVRACVYAMCICAEAKRTRGGAGLKDAWGDRGPPPTAYGRPTVHGGQRAAALPHPPTATKPCGRVGVCLLAHGP